MGRAVKAFPSPVAGGSPRGLLLEGIPGSGKSTIFAALRSARRVAARDEPSRFFLSEHLTQRVLERAHRSGSLNPADHREHLGRLVGDIRAHRDALADRGFAGGGKTGILYAMERFHLTHAIYYPHLSWDHVEGIDRDLGELGCRLCLLTADAADLRRRLLRPRWPGWLAYIQGYGSNPGEIVAHYRSQQEEYIALLERSCLPHLIVDTSRLGRDAALRRILDFWISEHPEGLM